MMTCDEVIELMQRHLDADLNDKEYEQMKSHVEQCPECEVMLERLERLNRDLGNLPKVTPSFSLVDSILPRLQEIDASTTEAGAGPEEEAGGGASPEGAGLAQRRSKNRRFTRSTFAKAGGIAAAALLGVMMVNGMPGLFQDSVNRMESNTASNAPKVAPMIATESAASERQDGSLGFAPGTEAEGMQKSADVYSKPSETPPASKADRPEDPVAVQDGGGFGIMGGAPMEPQAEDQAGSLSEASPPAESNAAPLEEPQEEPQEEPLMTPQAEQPPEDQPSNGISSYDTNNESAVPEESAPEEGVQKPRYGIAAQPHAANTDQSLASEDGAYTAVIEYRRDQTKSVAITESGGETAYRSQLQWLADAEIQLQSWENSKFTYTVSENGTKRTFVIDAENGTETEM